MKRKILVLLACILILAAVMPTSLFASPSNAAKLDKLTVKGIKAYDTALPTKGTKKTEKQINALLNKIKYQPAGKGDTTYRYTLSFEKYTSAAAGEYLYASKRKSWNKYDSKKKFYYSYGESVNFTSDDNATQCSLSFEDSKYYYNYYWTKDEKTGYFYKSKKTSSSGSGGSSTYKTLNYKLYADKTILGQKCLVYSYDYQFKSGTYTDKGTIYRFISRKTGEEIKYVSVGKNYIDTEILFDSALQKKAASFYTPPKNVAFTEDTGSMG